MDCVVYRCSKKEEMYLYVPDEGSEEERLQKLPKELLLFTGELTEVISLELSEERKLARVDVNEVMTALQEKGFFVQMPPGELLRKDDSMLFDPSDSL